ncbi:unnamed protein product, partial [Brugia timori]|uniref:NR LBD domain-containing protein n=2 Tax=Brugia TaxID=6278 RepID=A0A0R3R9N4_9BILA
MQLNECFRLLQLFMLGRYMSLSSYHYGKMADLQRVTRAQVAEHNTNSSVWMC